MAAEEGVAQREEARLAGLELRHSVISVRPLVGARGRSLSNSSDASLSTFLYLRGAEGIHVSQVPSPDVSVMDALGHTCGLKLNGGRKYFTKHFIPLLETVAKCL